MNKRLRLPLALSLALGSSTASALGLGQIEVKSGLNQPLSAEIPVLSSQAGETEALVVRLAPPEALARVGLSEPTGVAANLEFALEERAGGRKVIRVTTPGKVNDPFVTFLLEVDWGKGKMLREYTVLLDPPTMAPVRSAPVEAPVAETPAVTEPLPDVPAPPPMTETPAEAPRIAEPQAEPAAPAPEPQREPAPEPAAEAPPPEPEPAPEPVRERLDTYGPVAEGETLWSIAQYARPDSSVSMNQMMLALLYANPDAFIGQNINRLKKGAILRIPGREEAISTAAADAAAQVQEQMQSWRDGAGQVAQPAEPEPAPTPAPRTTSAPPRTDSRLELVPPRSGETATSATSGASVDGQGAELRAELARSREETASLGRENVELKSRVSELEKIQAGSQRLLELKDSELKAAQDALARLQANEAAADAVPPAATDAPPPATDASAEAATASAGTLAEAPSQAPADPAATAADPTATATDAAATAPTDPVVTSSDTTPGPIAQPASTEAAPSTEPLPPRPAYAPWYMNPFVLGGGGLVVVGLLALMLARRRGRAESAPVSSASAARYAGAVPSPAPREPVKVAPAQPARDRAAQLAEAVARDPGNLNRHLELVRYHYEAGDAAAFEQAAEAMYSRVFDPDHLAWKQVVAMGQELAPEHPLFVQDVAPEPAPIPVPAPVPAPAPLPPAVVPPAAAAAAPVAREVDWGGGAAPADSSTTQQMRLDDLHPAPVPAPPPPEPKFEPTFDPVPEFDAISSFDAEIPEAPGATAPAPDAGIFDADAASTKLELARAYLDMGDVEGARGMLEEVVSEGNPGQRAEAKRLLDEIR